MQFPWHFPQMIYAMTILQPRFYPHISSSRRGVAAARPIPVFKFTPSRFPIAIKYSRRRARPSPSIDGAASSPCTTFHTCVGCGSGMARRELIKFPLVSASSPRAFDSSITTAIKTSHPPPPEDLHPKCPPPPGSLSTPTGDSDDLRLPLSLIGDSERHISTVHLILFVAVALPLSHLHFDHARAHGHPEEISRCAAKCPCFMRSLSPKGRNRSLSPFLRFAFPPIRPKL